MALHYPESKEYVQFLRYLMDVGDRPKWKMSDSSRKWNKVCLHRKERRRAKTNPECDPMYRKNFGYEM